jgi:peptide/nickel transport system permease protein
MSVREMQYVEAARSLGFTQSRTIFKHILPNITGPIIVQAAANFATAILIEAGLSYLGLGAKTEVPTWGRMLSDNYGYIISGNNSFLALSPGLAIMLLVLAFNLLGNGLRDAFDVKTSLQGNR